MRTISTLLAMSLTGWAQSLPDLRGIYIYTNDVSQITKATATALTSSFGLSGVDGVAVVIGWQAIEPSMGQYDWSLLDQWIGQVAGLGKKIDLVVPAGVAEPVWLFQAAPGGAGAKSLSFTVSPHNGATAVCNSEVIAAPWDAAYLSQWDAMLVALAAHLKSAGTYNAVTLLRLTGINRTTEELRLPAEPAQDGGLACVTDAIATWQQAGYKPSLVMQAWNSILGSFAKSFPDKPFGVSLIPTSAAWPPINESGAIVSGSLPDLTQMLITAASQKFPAKLVVQYDFLMPGEAASAEVISSAQTLGTMAAFQTNEYLGGQGAACSEPVTNPAPCTAATFLTMLEVGIYPQGKTNPLRAQYIEVFHDNAAAFPDSVLTAHGELAPASISLVANAEGESPTIAPNTWVEIKGSGLSLTGHTRIWQGSDFVNDQMPTQLDGVSATVNGKNAFVWYISSGQVNILTPPDAMSGAVNVVVTNNGSNASFTAQAAALSPSFFVFDGTHVAAVHLNGTDIGPTTLYPGVTTPAKPGETVVIFANGFGPTSTPVISGSPSQSGSLSPTPVVKIGAISADVQFAGLVAPGEFQFNVVVPAGVADGDQPIVATYNGASTQSRAVITIQH
jgi:uncharacterized protein (TIGR03437 family)